MSQASSLLGDWGKCEHLMPNSVEAESLPGQCFHIRPPPTSADRTAPCKDVRKSGVIYHSLVNCEKTERS